MIGLADTIATHAGDVILQVNGADVGEMQHFSQLIRSSAVTTINIWRKGKALELIVPQSM
ncbi:MAG TPA: PDZ domain-containing protein [Acidobacteriota bacterium]|nr:PDZ domain-containing protein [Acidobacteriota bacterium]